MADADEQDNQMVASQQEGDGGTPSVGEYLDAGRGLAAQGKHREAVDAYLRALELRPRHKTAPVLLAQAYKAMGRTTDAIAALKRAVSQKPRNLKARLALATALADDGKAEDAKDVLLDGLALAPSEAGLLAGLARRLEESGEFAEANFILHHARQANPDKASLNRRFNRSKKLARDFVIEDADSRLSRSLMRSPEDGPTILALAEVREEAGQRKDALFLAQLARRVSPDDKRIARRARKIAARG